MKSFAHSRLPIPIGLIVCLLAICLVGCGGGSGSGGGVTPPSSAKKWTILVYLNAANNLQPFGGLNVNQMEQAGSTSNVNIVVQWKQGVCSDCTNASCPSCPNPSWKSTRRYYITKDSDTNNINSQLVQDMGPNIDMGDWHTLNDFINWGEKNYPADHYAVVIWDHGAGWLPTRAGFNKLNWQAQRAVSIDNSTNNEIETWQLPSALNVTTEVDDVIFDASLEQMAEIAYEIRNSAHYMVGSEQSPPGSGYYYNTFLTDLDANPNLSPIDLGKDIVTQTAASYSGSTEITQSIVDLGQMQNIETKLSSFADALLANSGNSSTKQAAINARSNSLSYVYPENKDLWDYSNVIKAGSQVAAVQSSAIALQTAIQSAVLLEMHSSDEAGSHGLAIYVPSQNDYNPSYANLALSRVSDWPAWLQQQALY